MYSLLLRNVCGCPDSRAVKGEPIMADDAFDRYVRQSMVVDFEQFIEPLQSLPSRPSSVNQLVQFMSLTGVYWADKPYILPVKRRLTLY
jgi:hypothetical protein